MKKIVNKLVRDEQGQALLMVLVMLLVGSLMVTPVLSFTATGLKSTQTQENRTLEFYATDAGIEDAIWKVKTNTILALCTTIGKSCLS